MRWVQLSGGRSLAEQDEMHEPRWHRCIDSVKARNAKKGTTYNPYSVCTASIGYRRSYTADHRKGAYTPAGRQRRLKGE